MKLKPSNSLIDTIIIPYVCKKRADRQLLETQRALVICKVFKGQVTDNVVKKLESINCDFVPVPANMTHFLQPLDLTINKSAKQFMRREFVMYYSAVKLDNGKQMEEIDVDFRLKNKTGSMAGQNVQLPYLSKRY